MAYSPVEKLEVLIKLAVNKYDFSMTASDTGIPERTLRRWANRKNVQIDIKRDIPGLLERAIERMLINIPENWTAHDWAVAVGILYDKWLLLQGKPTDKIEYLIKQIEGIPNDELERLFTEFQEAASRPVPPPAGEG